MTPSAPITPGNTPNSGSNPGSDAKPDNTPGSGSNPGNNDFNSGSGSDSSSGSGSQTPEHSGCALNLFGFALVELFNFLSALMRYALGNSGA